MQMRGEAWWEEACRSRAKRIDPFAAFFSVGPTRAKNRVTSDYHSNAAKLLFALSFFFFFWLLKVRRA